mgnify:FL=1
MLINNNKLKINTTMTIITKNLNKIILAIILIATMTSCQEEQLMYCDSYSRAISMTEEVDGMRDVTYEIYDAMMNVYEITQTEYTAEEISDFNQCLPCIGSGSVSGNSGWGFSGLTEEEKAYWEVQLILNYWTSERESSTYGDGVGCKALI